MVGWPGLLIGHLPRYSSFAATLVPLGVPDRSTPPRVGRVRDVSEALRYTVCQRFTVCVHPSGRPSKPTKVNATSLDGPSPLVGRGAARQLQLGIHPFGLDAAPD